MPGPGPRPGAPRSEEMEAFREALLAMEVLDVLKWVPCNLRLRTYVMAVYQYGVGCTFKTHIHKGVVYVLRLE